MIAPVHILMMAAVFSQTILADDGWTTSQFSDCMTKACPTYPQDICDQATVLACHNKAKKSHHKRATIEMVPSEEGDLETRDAPLYLATDIDAHCADSLPKHFLTNLDVQKKANEWCTDMKNDLLNKGAAKINPNLGYALAKIGNELHGNKAVMLSLVLGTYPPAFAAFKTIQNADNAIIDGCTRALQTLATKGPGCTKDINWYNDKQLNGRTGTGVVAGAIDMANNGVDWLFLRTDFLKAEASTKQQRH